MAKIHQIVKWAELISLQSIWLKFVNFAEQILFWQICLKNWPKSSNPLTFTQFDKIWSNLPFLLLCEFLDISEDWWNVSCSPQLKIILHWATLDWTGLIIIFFLSLVSKEIEKDNFFHLITKVRQKENSRVSVAQW